MTNFNWTDKDALKWFILLTEGHEGPYALSAIERKKANSLDVTRVWAEGLKEPVSLRYALEQSRGDLIPEIPAEEPPPLPPIPGEDEEEDREPSPPARRGWATVVFALILTAGVFFGLSQWLHSQEQVSIRRYPKMSLEIQQRIHDRVRFEGWGKELFFREFTSPDLTRIWLVTSGFQECDVELSFHSMEGNLLAWKDEPVAFRSKGALKDHVLELSTFEFINGTRIIPGLYEMDLHAENCRWGSLAARVGNKFLGPLETYITKTKVILYSKGPEEFNKLLTALKAKQEEKRRKLEESKELFWADLQQKLETVQAITSQIEQFFMDFLAQDPKQFSAHLKTAVDKYTRQFGNTLTRFVVSNEEYFSAFPPDQRASFSKGKNYEELVRLTCKKVGFESMKIIEELQTYKNPDRKKLNDLRLKVRSVFSGLTQEINQKIIQVSEDRST